MSRRALSKSSIIYSKLIITNYRSSSIRCGVEVSNAIEVVIKSSYIHVTNFLEHYAESKWCLDELVSILGSKWKFTPVFYDIELVALDYINKKMLSKSLSKAQIESHYGKDRKKGRNPLGCLIGLMKSCAK